MDTNLLVVIILVVGVLAFVVYLNLNKKQDDHELANDIKRKMSKIPSSLKTTSIHEMKSILIEYDKLFDYFLKKKGFKGETMGERLKDAKSFFDWETYNRIWIAHKMRNTLVHEIDAKYNLETIKGEIYSFQKALSKAVGL